VCYDIDGAEPTVTDANVILGYLNPDYLVGGELPINARKSWQAFDEKIARRLGLPVEQTAYGTHRIAASNMIRAIKAVSSERGRDVRDYALFAVRRQRSAVRRGRRRGAADAAYRGAAIAWAVFLVRPAVTARSSITIRAPSGGCCAKPTPR
jgi:hypothetical protein